MIVAQPLEEASNAVLPKGSSHLDGITAISDLLKKSKTLLWDICPKFKCLLCVGKFWNLFSSPIDYAFQSLFLFKILNIDLQYKS